MKPPPADQPLPRLTSPSYLRQLLREHDIRLSRSLGQHFLADANILQRIVEACALQGHETVVEVGAGVGTLTTALASHVDTIWAVEKDRRLLPLLREHLHNELSVTILRTDFLALELGSLGNNLVVVGNLPYGITSEVLLKLIRERHCVSRAVLMVQQEVGERLVQRPGARTSRLGVHLSAYYQVDKVRRVPRTAFYPPPEVESLLISLHPLSHSRIRSSPEVFEEVLKALYGARRKTAHNALSSLAPRVQVMQALSSLGLPPSVRGESLTVEQVDALARILFHEQ